MAWLSSLVLFAALFYINAEDEGFLPEYIHPCSMTDDNLEKCIEEQIQQSLSSVSQGIPEYSIPSIDPMNLEDIIIDGSGLKLNFSGAKLHGISKAKLTDLKAQIGQENETFTISLIANFSLTVKYIADGKILILPIKGDGDAVIDCRNTEVQISGTLIHVKGKDNGEHFKLVMPNYKYDIESTTFRLDNLFNGNKQLADTTLQFANENWRQLMDDLAPPVIKQLVKTVIKTINKFFSKVSITRIIRNYKNN